MSVRACRLVLSFAVVLGAWNSAAEKLPETVSIQGDITAMQSGYEFDVAGYHVLILSSTRIVSSKKSKKDEEDVRLAIVVGTHVDVAGQKEPDTRVVRATQVTVRDDLDKKFAGFAVIDRVIHSGTEPLFRADGYALRLNPATELKFSGGLMAMSDVGTNTWVHYDGKRNEAGEIVLSRAEFGKPKLPKPKHNPALEAQAVIFPPGSLVDFDGKFRSDRRNYKPEDAGGRCGWYPVPVNPEMQERVRTIGMRVIPQYQRSLPDSDPAKIAFRFYAVEENSIRSDLFCKEGLVLVPVKVIERLKNDDQLAALLADGVAANLQRQQARMEFDQGLIQAAELAAVTALGTDVAWVGGAIVIHEIQRKMERQRGRVALSLMADAGFDPWQAPEAWRLLRPGNLPKNLSKLKYPERADYQLEILGLQYKTHNSATSAVPTPDASAAIPTQ